MHVRTILHCTLLALALLAGCAAPQTQITAVGAPSAGPPKPVVGMRQAGAVSGKRQQVDFIADINPDCTRISELNTDFVSKPGHGSVEFQPVEQFATYPPTNIRSKCNDRRVPGTGVFYTSEQGFRRLDLFIVTVMDAQGSRSTFTEAVTVQ